MLFAAEPRKRRGPGLTPLIDVVFLLLLFFMLASRFDREALLPLAVHVASPDAAAAPDATRDDALRVQLDAAGRAFLSGRAVDDGSLVEAMRAAAQAQRGVRVRPHPEAPLQPIVDVLGLAQAAGAHDVVLEPVAAATKTGAH